MTSELALLEASLADSQRQTMSLGSRLALAETKNDELLAQSQVGLLRSCQSGLQLGGCSFFVARACWIMNRWLSIAQDALQGTSDRNLVAEPYVVTIFGFSYARFCSTKSDVHCSCNALVLLPWRASLSS
jgi:hypothetical protein